MRRDRPPAGGFGGGESSSLVLRGEPGIGKTALLSYAAERSRGRTVLRIAGVEAESDLGFAGLEGLLRPITGKLDELPQAQADALSAALGLAPSSGPDRLLVSAAALSLLAAAADDQPVYAWSTTCSSSTPPRWKRCSSARAGSGPSRWRCSSCAGGSRAGGRHAGTA